MRKGIVQSTNLSSEIPKMQVFPILKTKLLLLNDIKISQGDTGKFK
jgi:hypothetical protein